MRKGNYFYRLILIACLVQAGPLFASPESSLGEAYLNAKRISGTIHFPFIINSLERGDMLSADVFMLLNVPFTQFRDKLQSPRNWCEFLILTLNIKACVNQQISSKQFMVLYAGRKEYQPPEITYQLKYGFHILDNRAQYFDVELTADKGPMLTSNYHIRLQAAPSGKQTLLRLGMSYETSMFSRAATYTYLQTLGRNKIGFSIVGKDEHGQPRYIDGVKAVIERNVMRYFLALSVYMDSTKRVKKADFRIMLQNWFDATERYHAQLHEYARDTYIKAKLHERLNQQALQQQADSKAIKARRDS